MMLRAATFIVCVSMALAGCGGGGSSSGGTTPTPTPAPTPAPTPTPTVGIVAVTPSPLSTSTSFGGAMVSGGFFSLPTVPGAYVTYDAASNVYTLKGIPATQYESQQKPDTVLPSSASSDPTETRSAFDNHGDKPLVRILDYVTHTGASGNVFRYSAIGLHNYNSVTFGNFGSSYFENNLIAFGFPSAPSQVPASGKRTYVLEGFDLGPLSTPQELYNFGSSGWTVTLTVDFTSGTYVLSGNRSVTTEDTQATYVDTGDVSASGAFTRGGNAIAGTIHINAKEEVTPKPGTGTAQPPQTDSYSFDGPFSAAFFGPLAEEIGLTFTASGVENYHAQATAATKEVFATSQVSTLGGFLGHD